MSKRVEQVICFCMIAMALGLLPGAAVAASNQPGYLIVSDPPGVTVQLKSGKDGRTTLGTTPCTPASIPGNWLRNLTFTKEGYVQANGMAGFRVLEDAPAFNPAGALDAFFKGGIFDSAFRGGALDTSKNRSEIGGFYFARMEKSFLPERRVKIAAALVESRNELSDMAQKLRLAAGSGRQAARLIVSRVPLRLFPSEEAQSSGTLSLFDEVEVAENSLWGWAFVTRRGRDLGWVEADSFDIPPAGRAGTRAELKKRMDGVLAKHHRLEQQKLFYDNMAHIKTPKDTNNLRVVMKEVREVLARGETPSEFPEYWKGEEKRPDPQGTTPGDPVPSEWYTYYCPTGSIYHAAIPAAKSKDCNARFKHYARTYGCSLESEMGTARDELEGCW